MKYTNVDILVSQYFRSLGRMVGKNPRYFIVVPILISVLLTAGLLKMNYVTDLEFLYSPTNGPARHERLVIESIFPMNLSNNFDESRLTRMCPLGRILIEAKDSKSIFDKEVFQDLKTINYIVRNITVQHNQKQWNYESMCARKNDKCFVNKVFEFEDRLNDMINGKFTIEYPLMYDDNFNVFFSGAILGGVKTDEFNMITSATAVNLMYFLQFGDNARTWEDSFLQIMKDREFDHIHFAYYTSKSMEEELDKSFFSAAHLVSVAVIILLIFSSLSCMMLDWVKSKPWLGVVGCVSTVTAIGAAFGLTSFCGVEFISTNIAAPFLLLGIGMDDTFVLLAAWRRMNNRLSVPERLASTYAEAGVTITISSLTNMLSFLTGLTTPFHSIRIFCTYTAVAILFTYIYHITFFGSCMALFGYAEHQNLHSFVCRPAVSRSQSHDRSKCFQLFCTGGRNPLDPDNPLDNQENIMMKFFRDKLGVYLSNKRIKFSVLLMFLVYLTFGVWGCIRVKDNIEKTNMFEYNSYAREYYSLEHKYFSKYYLRIQVVINETLDYSDPAIQDEVNNMISEMENTNFMAGSLFTQSWLRSYQRFLNYTRKVLFKQGININNKEHFYLTLRDKFFPFTRHILDQDIKFSENFTEVTASRFVIQTKDVWDSVRFKYLMLKLREIARKSKFSVTVFNYLFLLSDQMFVFKSTTIQSIGVATIIMLIVLFIFIPNLRCVLWVGFSILSIEIGVVGFMNWFNVYLDTVSMINLIMCIGFSVDYSAHISYSYISSEEKDPNMRMRNTLYYLGFPIMQSCVSTLLGIVVLSFGASYIILVFFKIIFLVVLFAAFHSLILLPILLSLTESLGRCNNKSFIGFGKRDSLYVDNNDKYPYSRHQNDTKMLAYGTVSTLGQSLPQNSAVNN